MSAFWEPSDRWEPYHPDTVISGGPDRVYDSAPTDEVRRHVGFVAPAPTPELEPLLWEGDNA